MAARLVVCLFGLLLATSALSWWLAPELAAQNLGMPLLEGMARSTQIGDLSAVFAAGSAFCLIGAVLHRGTWIYCAALLLGFVAIGRCIAWFGYDAPFATVFISVEVIGAAVLTAMARFIDAHA